MDAGRLYAIGCGTKEAVLGNAGCFVNPAPDKPVDVTGNATKRH